MVFLDKKVFDLILKHAEKTYPEEAVGFLFGKKENENRFICEAFSVSNSAKKELRNRQFLISSESLLLSENAALEKNLEIVGVYHSHPDFEAESSSFDEKNALPDFSYLIISVKGGKAGEIKSFSFRNGKIGEKLENEKLTFYSDFCFSNFLN